VRVALHACISRNPQWVERSKHALAEIHYADASIIRAEAVAAREAFDLAAIGQTRAAANRLQRVIDELENPTIRGWLMEQMAAYLHFTDKVAAQKALTAVCRPEVPAPRAGRI
jgi:hypothetical protein